MPDPVGPVPQFTRPEGYDERLRRIREKQSAAAVLSPREPSQAELSQAEPSWLELANRRARRLGLTSAKDLLAHDLALLQASPYPGPECLEPHEIEAFTLGHLCEERQTHARACTDCGALIETLRPSAERRAQLLDEAARLKAAAARDEAAAATAQATARPALWSFVQDAAAATLPVAVALLLLLGVTGAPESKWLPALGALALVGGACLVSAWAMPKLARGPLMHASGGALVGGVAVATLIAVVIPSAWARRDRALVVARELAQRQVARFAAASWRAHQLDGRFLPAQLEFSRPLDPGSAALGRPKGRSSQPLQLKSETLGRSRAVYEISTEGIAGHMVAELRPDGGRLYWRADSHDSEAQWSLIAGKVQSVGSGSVTLTESSGARHRFGLSAGVAPVTKDDQVIAVVDAAGREVIDLYPGAPAASVPAPREIHELTSRPAGSAPAAARAPH